MLDWCQGHSQLPTRGDKADIGPADGHRWTVLDSPPTPTGQMLGGQQAARAPTGTRDIHGIGLNAAAGTAADSPANNAAGQRLTDALENH